MAKKTSPKASVRNKKKFILQLTGKGLILWLCLIFLVSGWMFVLGVLVGRGTAPVNFDIQSIQNELIALKESMLNQERRRNESVLEKGQAKNTFDFYEVLKGKQNQESIKIPLKKENQENPIKTAPSLKKKTVRSASVRKKDTTVQLKRPRKEGNFTVQVASTKDPKSAEIMVKKLQKKGYPAFSIKAEIPEKGTWYRVRVGYFIGKTDAESIRQQLTASGYEGIVVRK